MYLLDTNVVSEFRRIQTGRGDANVERWALQIPVSQQFMSAVTVLELERGYLRLARKDPPQAALLREWLDRSLFPSTLGQIISVNGRIATICAALHVPDQRPEIDALIAATALSHGLTMVTRNVADFAPMGVKLLNPWEPQE